LSNKALQGGPTTPNDNPAPMPATAIALVLAAALLHSLWNIAAKRAGGDDRFALFSAVLLTLIWAPVGIWAAWGVVPHWGWREWAALLASAVVHVVYFQTLLRGYRLADLTVVYPVARGSGPLVAGVNYLDRPATTTVAGWKRGMISL
jgi:drug/metabolite transporter (DMT)-like permease